MLSYNSCSQDVFSQFKGILLYEVRVITSLGGIKSLQECPIIIEQRFVFHTDSAQLNFLTSSFIESNIHKLSLYTLSDNFKFKVLERTFCP